VRRAALVVLEADTVDGRRVRAHVRAEVWGDVISEALRTGRAFHVGIDPLGDEIVRVASRTHPRRER